mgnify:CR=1 FL=1
MEYTNLGNTGLMISRICLGMMSYGDPGWRPWILAEDDARPFVRRALELEMRQRLHEQGVDFEPEIAVVTRLIPEARGTSCDQRLERVAGTRNARILRVPFRDAEGRIVQQWISRFAIWPYLERFAAEADS